MTEDQRLKLKSQVEALRRYIQLQIDTKKEVPPSILEQLSTLENKLNPNLKSSAKSTYATALSGEVVKCESNLECYMFTELERSGIIFKKDFDVQVYFELQPGFKIESEKALRPIDIFPDFFVYGKYIIDTKGMITPDWAIKWKMLKYKHRNNFKYFVAQSQKECREVINTIKFLEKK